MVHAFGIHQNEFLTNFQTQSYSRITEPNHPTISQMPSAMRCPAVYGGIMHLCLWDLRYINGDRRVWGHHTQLHCFSSSCGPGLCQVIYKCCVAEPLKAAGLFYYSHFIYWETETQGGSHIYSGEEPVQGKHQANPNLAQSTKYLYSSKALRLQRTKEGRGPAKDQKIRERHHNWRPRARSRARKKTFVRTFCETQSL